MTKKRSIQATPFNKSKAKQWLPERSPSSNKTDGGKCLILAGSKSYWGAAVLSAKAAARIGAGYTYLHSEASDFPTVKNPDFIFRKRLTATDLEQFDAVAIGPGLQSEAFVLRWLRALVKHNFSKVVLDAEALNVLAKNKSKIKPLDSWLLTPHEGELSRLLQTTSAKIKQDRIAAVTKARSELGCRVLLKGADTLVADTNKLWLISTGNPALAKAGTGDVLTGMIAGLMSQGLDSIQAACLGAYLHGKVADEWIKAKKDQLSLLATDLIENMPESIFSLRN